MKGSNVPAGAPYNPRAAVDGLSALDPVRQIILSKTPPPRSPALEHSGAGRVGNQSDSQPSSTMTPSTTDHIEIREYNHPTGGWGPSNR
ncbi:hypothetical protein MPLSOD_120302 [Mesorhizobium sp. SOD10]|nr:hypothetical protein MPLSOD_120302 [Mesorhizobium sp. SOD10]